MSVFLLTASNFDDAIAGARAPVVVKFYAPWCPMCQSSRPTYHALAAENAQRAHFGAVNVDADAQLAEREGIKAIPTFVVYANRRRVKVVDGFDERTKATLEQALRVHGG